MKLRLLAFAVLASVAAAPALSQGSGAWKAMTKTAHSPQMDKEVNGITWRCNVNTCYAMAGATAETVGQMQSCQALVQWVGPLSSYSGTGVRFSSAQLTQCNAAPPPPAPTVHINPNTIKPQGTKPPITVPPIRPPG